MPPAELQREAEGQAVPGRRLATFEEQSGLPGYALILQSSCQAVCRTTVNQTAQQIGDTQHAGYITWDRARLGAETNR